MCILASRENTCIHDSVAYDPRRNELCRSMLLGPVMDRCCYHSGATRFRGQSSLVKAGLYSAWDIEDLVKMGRSKRACPYYVIRAVHLDADIVFCPYNYLIDPLVRKSMDINLNGNIVILDEAHNIEDTGREAGSFSVKDCELVDTYKNLEGIGTYLGADTSSMYRKLSKMVSALHDWLTRNLNNLIDDSVNQSSTIMSGAEIVACLSLIGLGPEDFHTFSNCLAYIKEHESTMEEMDAKCMMSGVASTVLSGLNMVLGLIYRENMRFVDDYKVAIIKALTTRRTEQGSMDKFLSRHSSSWVVSLNFWCLNPAVSFVDIKENVRSVILTSGTLSPMDSFQSELGIPFSSKLETNHVIDTSQVWVGSIGAGPNAVQLLSTYQNTEKLVFQDEIGQIVLKVCETVPYGILFFVSSYNLLEKLCHRWQANGIWDEISKKKLILCEPRGSDKARLEETLSKFYDAVDESSDQRRRRGQSAKSTKGKRKRSSSLPPTTDGSLLMAVCRGKISEGLDFSDNFARAVITCGIPFPNIKDLQVELKRKYNDVHSHSLGLLSGHKWYEIQAFRAINQALGRCIRHRNDWGALILLDSRFSHTEKYVKPLSKWIRGNICHHEQFHPAMESLKQFIELQKRRLLSSTNLSGCESPMLSQTSPCVQPSSQRSIYGAESNGQPPPPVGRASQVALSSGVKMQLVESGLSPSSEISLQVSFSNSRNVAIPLPEKSGAAGNMQLVCPSPIRESSLKDVTSAAHNAFEVYPCVSFTSTPVQVLPEVGDENQRSPLTLVKLPSGNCHMWKEAFPKGLTGQPEAVDRMDTDRLEAVRDTDNETPPLFPDDCFTSRSPVASARLPDGRTFCSEAGEAVAVQTKLHRRQPNIRVPCDYFSD